MHWVTLAQVKEVLFFVFIGFTQENHADVTGTFHNTNSTFTHHQKSTDVQQTAVSEQIHNPNSGMQPLKPI